MAAIHSVDNMEAELRGMLAKNKAGLDPKPVLLDDGYIRDFAKIGSLMSDEIACVNHLARLNTSLLMIAERRNLRRRGKYFGGSKRKLVKETFNYQATDGQQTAGTFRKHDNMLKQFLDTWEGIHGFNAASDGEGGLPGRTPLLTGFVQPPDFRKYLLKHGFHWTDIGVAANHGEFTHRLHWYIICAEQMATPQWLLHQPIESALRISSSRHEHG